MVCDGYIIGWTQTLTEGLAWDHPHIVESRWCLLEEVGLVGLHLAYVRHQVGNGRAIHTHFPGGKRVHGTGGKAAWGSVGLVVLVVKVLDWVGSLTGVRVVLLDARIEEVEGATVVSCWCSVDEEAQPMVGAGVVVVGDWGWWKVCNGARCTCPVCCVMNLC